MVVRWRRPQRLSGCETSERKQASKNESKFVQSRVLRRYAGEMEIPAEGALIRCACLSESCERQDHTIHEHS